MGMTVRLRLLIAALLLVALPVQAQSWPEKPVRIVVPFPPGGSNDTLCRIVADKLSSEWKQPVIVDNKPCAAGNIGAQLAYNAPGDGYTLLCAPPPPLAINHNLYKYVPFDWTRFVPITVLAITPNVISARKDFPAESAKELVAYAKANPGKVTYASQGNGSTSHLTTELFSTMTGIKLVHVPYKGEGPALLDLMAGRVDIFLGNIAAALRFQKSGEVKFFAVASRTRSPVAPDVPTAAEVGFPDLVSAAWFGLVGPPGTPDSVIQKVNADTAAALKLPDVRAKFLDQGAEPQGMSPQAAAQFIRDEEMRWRGVIKSANVTLE